jgi:6,7-dimethyl-8-ribityllumazine synthase
VSEATAGESRVDCSDLGVAVVATRRHAQVVDGLLAGARRALADHRVEQPSVVRVPGPLELPVVVGALAHRGYDAVVALGLHLPDRSPGHEVGAAVTAGLSRVSVDTGVAVGIGLLVCGSLEEALDLAGPGSGEDQGYATAEAALATAMTLRRIRRGYEADPS